MHDCGFIKPQSLPAIAIGGHNRTLFKHASPGGTPGSLRVLSLRLRMLVCQHGEREHDSPARESWPWNQDSSMLGGSSRADTVPPHTPRLRVRASTDRFGPSVRLSRALWNRAVWANPSRQASAIGTTGLRADTQEGQAALALLNGVNGRETQFLAYATASSRAGATKSSYTPVSKVSVSGSVILRKSASGKPKAFDPESGKPCHL